MTETRPKKDFFANSVLVALGTTAGHVVCRYLRLADCHGFNDTDNGPIPIIHVDHSAPYATGAQGQQNDDERPLALPPGTTLPARLPDEETLEELEANDRLWFVETGRQVRQGVIAENRGTGNDSRMGALLFQGVREHLIQRLVGHLRRIQEYLEQWRNVRHGNRERDANGMTTVYVVLSTAGGMGTGSLPGCLYAIREAARRLGIEVKVVVVSLGLGTLQPPNPIRAAANEASLLTLLAAVATGLVPERPFHADAGEGAGKLYDSLVFLTNNNEHGEIASLEELEEMAAHWLFTVQRTPLGGTFRETVINMENGWEPDRYGVPSVASTAGLSVIHADRAKALAYCELKLGAGLLEELATSSAPARIQKQALAFVASHALVESEDEAQAADTLLVVKELNRGNVVEHAQAMVSRGAQGDGAFNKCMAIARWVAHVLQTVIPGNIQPMMQRKAERLAETTARALQENVKERLTQRRGPADALAQSRLLVVLLERFAQANQEKLNALADASRRALEDLDNNRRELERIRRLPTWLRWIHWFTLRQIARNYEVTGEQAVAAAIEIEARNLLAKVVYPGVREAASQAVSRVTGLVATMAQLGAVCEGRANRKLSVTQLETAPVGVQLVDAPFLQVFYRQVLQGRGGEGELRERVLAGVLNAHGSIETLASGNPRVLEEAVLKQARACFEPSAQKLDVYTALRRVCPEPARQQAYVRQCVQESQGRVRPRGGMPQSAKWFKVVGAAEMSWAQEYARKAAAASVVGGTWNSVVLPGGDEGLVFLQYAAGLSLRCLVDGKRGPKSVRGVRRAIAGGADPVTATLPTPRPARSDALVALVKAWSLDGLQLSGGRGVVLASFAGPEFLGRDLDEAIKRLWHAYPLMVEVGVRFARSVAGDADAILSKLNGLRQAQQAAGTVKRLVNAVNLDTVECVLAEAQELKRYARGKGATP